MFSDKNQQEHFTKTEAQKKPMSGEDIKFDPSSILKNGTFFQYFYNEWNQQKILAPLRRVFGKRYN